MFSPPLFTFAFVSIGSLSHKNLVATITQKEILKPLYNVIIYIVHFSLVRNSVMSQLIAS